MVVPRMHSRLLPRWFLTFFDTSRPGLALPPLAWKCTADSCGLSMKMMVNFSWYAGTGVALGTRKPTRCCLECRCIACVNPTICRIAAFSRHLSRCYPLSYCLPLLGLCCADETSSAQQTDHLRPFSAPADTAQGRGKERSMCR